MEFSECLDIASMEPDSLKRIAFVAAFAMSNYSSTIGRIAKPFNPMLVRPSFPDSIHYILTIPTERDLRIRPHRQEVPLRLRAG